MSYSWDVSRGQMKRSHLLSDKKFHNFFINPKHNTNLYITLHFITFYVNPTDLYITTFHDFITLMELCGIEKLPAFSSVPNATVPSPNARVPRERQRLTGLGGGVPVSLVFPDRCRKNTRGV